MLGQGDSRIKQDELLLIMHELLRRGFRQDLHKKVNGLLADCDVCWAQEELDLVFIDVLMVRTFTVVFEFEEVVESEVVRMIKERGQFLVLRS